MFANFPSRAELLSWVSDLTKIKVEKLQQLSDGIQFCQIFDIIYPKVVNLNKLKRDAKGTLEKEKNFRFLLNAISQLQLKVNINIMDLACGKVTAILELLQWMWREHQKPSLNNEKKDGEENKEFEPRVIKSYVGKLVSRPNLSLAKVNQKSEATKSNGSGRRSLDARLNSIPKTQNSEKSVKTAINPIQRIQKKSVTIEESEIKEKVSINLRSAKNAEGQKFSMMESMELKEKNLDVSQTKDLTVFLNQPEQLEKKIVHEFKNSPNSQKNQTKIWIFNDDPESLNKIYSEKKQHYKKMKAEKESARNKKERNISQILDSALSLDREKLCQKLIKVTDAVLQSNPELEEKLKKLILSQEASDTKKPAYVNQPYLKKYQSLESSYQNNSFRCQNDTNSTQEININGPSINQNQENYRRELVIVEPPQISSDSISANMNINDHQKTEHLKKLSIKQKDRQTDHQMVLPPHVIKQISVQKEKAESFDNQDKIQNKPQTSSTSIPNFQKTMNIFNNNLQLAGIEFFTQKKNDPYGQKLFGSKKKPRSENPNLYGICGHTQNNERQNQRKFQKEANSCQKVNQTQNKKTEEDVKYPELNPYTSATIEKSSSKL